MSRLADVIEFLEEFAPLELAEDWDNVGLLIGDVEQTIESAMTCLTLTPDVAAEAASRNVDLVVSHHPLLFRPVQRLTSQTTEGRMLLGLIAAHVAVYSPHTAYDSTAGGINQRLAESLSLMDIDSLRPHSEFPPQTDDRETGNAPSGETSVGSGRFGRLPQAESLGAFNQRVKTALGIRHLQFVGDEEQRIERVAVACGSAAEFLPDARRHACDVLLTGEARFHACLEARTTGIAMVLAGHYATERPAVVRLAERLAVRFPDIDSSASAAERDPVLWSLS